MDLTRIDIRELNCVLVEWIRQMGHQTVGTMSVTLVAR